MKLQVFSVFDSKVGAFTSPFMARTRGEAIRSFIDAVNDEKLPIRRHGADYRLFFLGDFDDQSGRYESVQPEPVIGADEIDSITG